MQSLRRRCGLVVLVCMTSTVMAAEENLARLCKDWAKNGRDSYKELGVPPQVSPIVTDRYKGKHGDQVIELLGRKHSSDGPIDAYVKFQLISFEPDLKQATSKQLENIVEAMPEIEGYPTRPPSELLRVIEISKREKVDNEALVKVASDFNVSVKGIASRNSRSFDYRKRLIEALPDEGGYKLYATLLTYFELKMTGQTMPIRQKRDPKTKQKVNAEPAYDIAYAVELAAKTGELDSGMKRNLLGVLNKMRVAKDKVKVVASAGVDKAKNEIKVNWRGTGDLLGKDDEHYAWQPMSPNVPVPKSRRLRQCAG